MPLKLGDSYLSTFLLNLQIPNDSTVKFSSSCTLKVERRGNFRIHNMGSKEEKCPAASYQQRGNVCITF